MISYLGSKVHINGKTKKCAVDESLIPPAPCAPDIAGHWHLVMTAPKREGSAILSLKENGWTAWTPQMTHWVTTGHVMRRKHTPLFSRYVFVASQREGGHHYKKPVSKCEHVSFVLSINGKPSHIPLSLVMDLSNKQEAGAFDKTLLPDCHSMKILPSHFRAGKRHKIKSGAFTGLVARIVSLAPRDRVRILIETVSHALAAEIAPEYLEMDVVA